MNKAILSLLILLLGAAFWFARQPRVAAARQTVAELRQQQAGLERRIAGATIQLDGTEQALRVESGRPRRTWPVEEDEPSAGAGAPEVEEWVEPPHVWPDWEADSPYVWLRKEMFPRLPIDVFRRDGALTGEIAEVLALTEPQWRVLNATFRQLVADYRALESDRVEVLDEHLPGIVGDGPKLTIQVPASSEHGEKYKEEIERVLHEEIGFQRAELILTSGRGGAWIDKEFSHFGESPKIISVVQHQNGTHNISIRSGNSWLSVGGRIDPAHHVPPHLLPYFREVAGELGFHFPHLE